jgi:hypothetical protein
MDKNGFENVVLEFAPKFEELKQLARKLPEALATIPEAVKTLSAMIP